MTQLTVEERSAWDVLRRDAQEWDELATPTGGPFLSAAWLRAWVGAFAPHAVCVLVRGAGGELRAGACVVPGRTGGLRAAANIESGEWSLCGQDQQARGLLWERLARRGARRITFPLLPAGSRDADAAGAALRAAGYHLVDRQVLHSPRLQLPSSRDELLQQVTRNLRSQYRRRRRRLEERGALSFRTGVAASWQTDLRTFLSLESSGWKRTQGTAIASQPRTLALYTGFTHAAAREGWLRMQFLELDGRAVAADLSCSFAGGVYMVKTAYDERLAELSPGLVLRGRALEAAVEDGFHFYDFLGGIEPYKLRWGAVPRPRVSLLAFRPLLGVLPYGYHAYLRPGLKDARDAVERVRRRHGTGAEGS